MTSEAAAVLDAARQVAHNAYGTRPRHTAARGGDCRDDCIPCGMGRLRAALAAWDKAEGNPADDMLAED